MNNQPTPLLSKEETTVLVRSATGYEHLGPSKETMQVLEANPILQGLVDELRGVYQELTKLKQDNLNWSNTTEFTTLQTELQSAQLRLSKFIHTNSIQEIRGSTFLTTQGATLFTSTQEPPTVATAVRLTRVG